MKERECMMEWVSREFTTLTGECFWVSVTEGMCDWDRDLKGQHVTGRDLDAETMTEGVCVRVSEIHSMRDRVRENTCDGQSIIEWCRNITERVHVTDNLTQHEKVSVRDCVKENGSVTHIRVGQGMNLTVGGSSLGKWVSPQSPCFPTGGQAQVSIWRKSADWLCSAAQEALLLEKLVDVMKCQQNLENP